MSNERYFSIFTLGCKLNQLESEAIADSFRKAGFRLVPWDERSENPRIIIVNTCTVTSKADQKARRMIRKLLKDNPEARVIVTGCYAQLDAEEIMLLEEQNLTTEDTSYLRYADAEGENVFVSKLRVTPWLNILPGQPPKDGSL
jgi:threonylcarbamoyladenosine tRNA methylthiotransferase MtaB